MNTTALITHWTMDGARGDLDRRFSPSVDILAAVSELTPEPVEAEVHMDAPAAPSPLLVKRAGDDEWQPLAVGG